MIKKAKILIPVFALVIMGLVINVNALVKPGDKGPLAGKVGPKVEEKKKVEPVKVEKKVGPKEEKKVGPKEDALATADKLVKKAKESLKKEDVDAAKTALDKVKGKEKEVTNLRKELEEVSYDITVRELVNKLDKKVTDANCKHDIDLARYYKHYNKIESKIDGVHNKKLKDELNKKFNKIDKILSDYSSPIVNIKDNTITNEDLKVFVYDNAKFDIKLNGENINNKYLVSEEGKYVLVVTDESFNTTKVHFIIDKTAPVITVKDDFVGNEDLYSYVNFSITDNYGLDKAILNKKYKFDKFGLSRNLSYDKYSFMYKQGENTWSVYDLAGNKAKYVFEFDNVKPEVVSQVQKYNETKKRVELTTEFSETVKTMGGNNAIVTTTKVTTYYYRTKTVTVKFTDLAGNENSYTVNIDMSAPKLDVSYSTTALINGDVDVVITSNEKVKEVDGWTLSEDELTLTKTFSDNTKGKVKVYDLTGNSIEAEYEVNNIIDDTDDITKILKDSEKTKIELKLDDDIDMEKGIEVPENKEFIIDLNENELNIPSIYNAGKLKIVNGTVNSGIEIYNDGSELIADNITLNVEGQGINSYAGNVEVKNSTINATDWAVLIYGTGSIKDSTLTSTDSGYTIYSGGVVSEISNVIVNQNGEGIGIYVEDGSIDLIKDVCITTNGIGIDNSGVIGTINNLTVQSGSDAIFVNAGTVGNIIGSNLTSTSSYSIYNYDGTVNNITSGEFKGSLGALLRRNSSEFTTITGGKFVKGTNGVFVSLISSTDSYSEFVPSLATGKKFNETATYTEVIDED